MKKNQPMLTLAQMIWSEVERNLFAYLASFVDCEGCKFVGRRTAKDRVMVMTDLVGRNFKVDAVIIDESCRPLALVEFPGFTNNAAQLCESHQAIKQKYTSIKNSLVVAADSWNEESVNQLRSCGIDFVQISLTQIRLVLAQYGIEFVDINHEDKTQIASKIRFAELSFAEKNQIGRSLIASLESAIETSLAKCFADFGTTSIARVKIELESNQGEVATREFTHLPDAVYFLHYADANSHELW